MTYRIALMGFNGDYRIKNEQFENTDDALDYGAPVIRLRLYSWWIVKTWW